MREPEPPTEADAAARVRRWVRRVVVDLELCPFARRELEGETLRLRVSAATGEEALLECLAEELALLEQDRSIETTLLIHPAVLRDFMDFNQFLDRCDALLGRSGLEGTFQIASFHPDYRFAGTGPADAENYSNRSPYPMLHILREESVARAIAGHPDIDSVPRRNIERLRELGAAHLRRLLQDCAHD